VFREIVYIVQRCPITSQKLAYICRSVRLGKVLNYPNGKRATSRVVYEWTSVKLEITSWDGSYDYLWNYEHQILRKIWNFVHV